MYIKSIKFNKNKRFRSNQLKNKRFRSKKIYYKNSKKLVGGSDGVYLLTPFTDIILYFLGIKKNVGELIEKFNKLKGSRGFNEFKKFFKSGVLFNSGFTLYITKCASNRTDTEEIKGTMIVDKDVKKKSKDISVRVSNVDLCNFYKTLLTFLQKYKTNLKTKLKKNLKDLKDKVTKTKKLDTDDMKNLIDLLISIDNFVALSIDYLKQQRAKAPANIKKQKSQKKRKNYWKGRSNILGEPNLFLIGSPLIAQHTAQRNWSPQSAPHSVLTTAQSNWAPQSVSTSAPQSAPQSVSTSAPHTTILPTSGPIIPLETLLMFTDEDRNKIINVHQEHELFSLLHKIGICIPTPTPNLSPLEDIIGTDETELNSYEKLLRSIINSVTQTTDERSKQPLIRKIFQRFFNHETNESILEIDFKNNEAKHYGNAWYTDHTIFSNNKTPVSIFVGLIPNISDPECNIDPRVSSICDTTLRESKNEMERRTLISERVKYSLRSLFDAMILKRVSIAIIDKDSFFSSPEQPIYGSNYGYSFIKELVCEVLNEPIGPSNPNDATPHMRRYNFFSGIYIRSFNEEESEMTKKNMTDEVFQALYEYNIDDNNKLELIVTGDDYKDSYNSKLYSKIKEFNIQPLNYFTNEHIQNTTLMPLLNTPGDIVSLAHNTYDKKLQITRQLMFTKDIKHIQFLGQLYAHIKRRFLLLKQKLEDSDDIQIIMFGDPSKVFYDRIEYVEDPHNADDSNKYKCIGSKGHLLGCSFSDQTNWGIIGDSIARNNWLLMMVYLDNHVNNLCYNFPNRVSFEYFNLEDIDRRKTEAEPQLNTLYVWSATSQVDLTNFNEEELNKSYSIANTHVKGFGIICSPTKLN
jgi:hypothetical protein